MISQGPGISDNHEYGAYLTALKSSPGSHKPRVPVPHLGLIKALITSIDLSLFRPHTLRPHLPYAGREYFPCSMSESSLARWSSSWPSQEKVRLWLGFTYHLFY